MTLFIIKHIFRYEKRRYDFTAANTQSICNIVLETLVKEKKSKSQFIRESINRSLFRINDKSCRKKEILELDR